TLDHGDVQSAALDDVEPVTDIPPDRIGNGSGRPRHTPEDGGLIFDVSRGELARVVFGVPRRQPDQAELVLRSLKYGVAIAVPTRRGGLAALLAEQHGQLHLTQDVAPDLFPAHWRLEVTQVDRHRPIGPRAILIRMENLFGREWGFPVGLVDRLPAPVVGKLRAEDQAL